MINYTHQENGSQFYAHKHFLIGLVESWPSNYVLVDECEVIRRNIQICVGQRDEHRPVHNRRGPRPKDGAIGLECVG